MLGAELPHSGSCPESTGGRSGAKYRAYAGLDIRKVTIAAVVVWPGCEEPEHRGILPNRKSSLQRLICKLQVPYGETARFAYEAAPSGCGIYRGIIGTGHDCQVVAPGLIPRKPGDRVKTDRRAAVSLAPLKGWVAGVDRPPGTGGSPTGLGRRVVPQTRPASSPSRQTGSLRRPTRGSATCTCPSPTGWCGLRPCRLSSRRCIRSWTETGDSGASRCHSAPGRRAWFVPSCLTLAPISKLDTTPSATPLWPCPRRRLDELVPGGVQAAGRRRSGRGAGNHRPVWCQRARVIERPRPLYATLALDRAFEWPVFRGRDFVATAGDPFVRGTKDSRGVAGSWRRQGPPSSACAGRRS